MKIRYKLILSLIIFIACTGVAGIMGMRDIDATNKTFEKLASTDIPSINSLLEIKALSRQVSVKSMEYSLRGNEGDKEKALDSIDTLKDELILIEDTIDKEVFIGIEDKVRTFLENIIAYIQISDKESVLQSLEMQKHIDQARQELFHYIDGLEQKILHHDSHRLLDLTSESRQVSVHVLQYYNMGLETDRFKARESIENLKGVLKKFINFSELDETVIRDIQDKTFSFINQSENYLNIIAHSGIPLNEKVRLQSEVHRSRKELIHSLYPIIDTQKEKLMNALQTTAKAIDLSINSFLIALILITLFAVVLGYLVSSSIVHKIERLKDAANKIGEGNFDAPINISSNDEVGDLAISLTAMTRNLKESEAKLVSANKSLKKMVQERKEIEKGLIQTQKMEAIGTLAGGIARDFNNILAGIIGYTELALGDVEGRPTTKKRLERVLEGAIVRPLWSSRFCHSTGARKPNPNQSALPSLPRKCLN